MQSVILYYIFCGIIDSGRKKVYLIFKLFKILENMFTKVIQALSLCQGKHLVLFPCLNSKQVVANEMFFCSYTMLGVLFFPSWDLTI